ncbi:Putative tagatose-6-phosphate ketose/aldose isomerase [Pluralibacter gergoviae]|nr:Putative tagatose-6-phosphate ketose/aldose isomerase [Pluralibacter gergoviae]
MPQTQTLSGTGTWTEEEIRQQPASWIRSLTHIDSIRQQIDAFLAPLLTKKDLRIVLTGAGTSAFIGDIIAPWLSRHTGKNL